MAEAEIRKDQLQELLLALYHKMRLDVLVARLGEAKTKVQCMVAYVKA